MTTTYIYALHDPRDNAVKYVGKTVNLKTRMRKYRQPCNRKSQAYLNAWITGLERIGLFPMVSVLEVCEGQSWVEAERRWIAYYRASGAELCNLSSGGEGEAGRVVSADTRAKLSRINTGKVQTSEAKARQIAAQMGRKNSPETRRKLREANRGKAPSPATLKAASETNRQKWATGVYPTPAQQRQREGFIAIRPNQTGYRFTEEQRARLRASQQARRQREVQLGA